MKKLFVRQTSLLLILILIVSSCKTLDKTQRSGIARQYDNKTEALASLSDIDPELKTLSSRLSIKAGGISFSGNLRMEKDSVIWISISKFGFEGARLMIRKDSVFYINKLNSESFQGDYSFLSSLMGFNANFEIVQALLLGRDFKSYDPRGYSIEESEEDTRYRFYNRKPKDRSLPNINQAILCQKEPFQIIRNIIGLGSQENSIDLSYSNYRNINDIIIPGDYKILLPFFRDEIIIQTTRHSINQSLDYPFSIPESYKKLEL